MEKVKRMICLICLLAVFLAMAPGCAMVPPYPEMGNWYCEELNMTLDMENYTAKYLNDSGEYDEAEVNIDYGGHIYIERSFEYGKDMEMILRGDYRYRNGKFKIIDAVSGHQYIFVMLTEAS